MSPARWRTNEVVPATGGAASTRAGSVSGTPRARGGPFADLVAYELQELAVRNVVVFLGVLSREGTGAS